MPFAEQMLQRCRCCCMMACGGHASVHLCADQLTNSNSDTQQCCPAGVGVPQGTRALQPPRRGARRPSSHCGPEPRAADAAAKACALHRRPRCAQPLRRARLERRHARTLPRGGPWLARGGKRPAGAAAGADGPAHAEPRLRWRRGGGRLDQPRRCCISHALWSRKLDPPLPQALQRRARRHPAAARPAPPAPQRAAVQRR